MKLEIGKYYTTRCGSRVGPVELSFWEGLYTASGDVYEESGRHGDEGTPDACIYNIPELDIVAEWEEPMVTKMKTWGEMTDVEKGALLLAHHEGKEIEWCDWLYKEWTKTVSPIWDKDLAYRVKKLTVKDTKVMHMFCKDGTGPCISWYMTDPTHKITFDTIDGEPDCSSIKMEKV